MKKHSFIALMLSVSLSNVCYGDARSEIIIENNCSVPIFLNVLPGNSTGKTITNQKLLPHQYVNLGQYTNDKIVDYRSNNRYQLSF